MRSIFLMSALLVACVGDDSATDAGNTDAGNNDVVTNDVSTNDVTTIDAPLVCDGGTTVLACNGSCVDVATSGANCGKCGHDCGGAMCTAGACQPGVVADTLAYPVFDVDATNVYFNKGTSGQMDLEFCPSSGCKLQPTKLSTPGNIETADIGGWMELMGKNIAFLGEASVQFGKWRVFACDQVNGCGTTPVTIANQGLQSLGTDFVTTGSDVYFTNYKNLSHANCTAGNTCTASENLVVSGTVWPHIALSADSAGVYYLDPTSHVLEKCGTTGTCTPTAMSNAFSTNVKNTFAYGNMIWILDPAVSGTTKGTISTCANAGFCTTPTVFINGQHYPTLFRVDADGVYWYDADTQDITMCPLSGCKPSTTTLVATAPIVTSFRTDAKFVYWATDTQILRVAKP